MKILVLCSAGLNRSGAMLRVLKKDYKDRRFDALNAGLQVNERPTLEGLIDWADKIIVMDARLAPLVGPKGAKKVVVADVGDDIWGSPTHPDLLRRCKVMAQEWDRNGWKMQSFRLHPKPEEITWK